MLCPICKTDSLEPVTLQDGVPVAVCPGCHGAWISSNPYLAWLREQSAERTDQPPDESFDPAWDTKTLKLCPDCGRIMARYQVFANRDFHLDRCGHCNGVWFDRNEWDAIAALNLHDNLNQFFTAPWQDKIHKEEKRTRLEALYLEHFGQQDYDKIKEMRAWLERHPERSMLLAFLQAQDPYK